MMSEKIMILSEYLNVMLQNTENNYIRMLLIMLNILDHFPYLEKLKYFLGGELCRPHVLNL